MPLSISFEITLNAWIKLFAIEAIAIIILNTPSIMVVYAFFVSFCFVVIANVIRWLEMVSAVLVKYNEMIPKKFK